MSRHSRLPSLPFRRLVGPVLALAALFLWAAPAAAEDASVTVGHNRLEPAEVTIQAGETVVFHNVDKMPGGHTLVAEDGAFESPPLDEDQKWSHTFEKAGTHSYRIQQHPEAVGKIVVE